MTSLLIVQGALAGQRFEIVTQLVLGRAGGDVTIDDPLVSRRHAVLRRADGGVEIEDLGSLNGTWVNGERITGPRRVVPGDVIACGDTTMAIEGNHAAQRGTLRAPLPPIGRRPHEPWAPPPGGAAREELEDELRTVTALFADVVGSTGLGERLGAHEAKTLIGECVTRMSRAVERYGGNVQAYMGDGIAAFFGIPTAHEDDPERAARAGLDVLDAVRDYAAEVESVWGIPDFSARVGINTGEAAVGLVGASEPQAVAVGDATNVAARLQSLAAPGTVAVGEKTARSLVHRFALEPLGSIPVRGRERPVDAWRLVAPQPTMPVQPATPLVDRAAELERMRAVFDELEAGRGRVVLLVGEAGIGKTRLLAELRSLAADRATWLEGHCLSYGTELLYDPFIRILRSWIGAEEAEPAVSVEAKLRGKLALVPALGGDADLLPFLARVLALDIGGPAGARLDALPLAELGSSIRRACTLWLASLAERGPVVVALEDLQWLDSSSAQLAEGLLELTERVPLLLIGTLRADPTTEGWRLRGRIAQDYAHRSVELTLERLSDKASRTLLESLTSSHRLDASSLDLIVASAEGNPLYLEELLNAFADGTARRRGETWAPTATSQRVLTPTLEGLMLSRIDRLPRKARRLAQTAAVVGRRFPLGVLEHLEAAEGLTETISILLRADIIHEAARYPEVEYTFRHGLLRQAVLATLPPPRLRALYGAVAAAFEAHLAGSTDDHMELLAHYYVRSDDLARALECLERAAMRAAALDARGHAAELWDRAVKVAARLGDEQAGARFRALAETARGLEGADAAVTPDL